jgi:outer membrane usher protein FimD/PapC
MSTRRLRIFSLGALLVGCTPATAAAQTKEDLFNQVFGNKAAAQRSIEAELEVDGYSRDAVPIEVAGNKLLDVDLGVLRERLSDLLDEATSDCLQADADGDRVKQARDCGVALEYDAAALKLKAEIPARLRREQVLAVRSATAVRAPTASEAQLSGYLNLSASARRQSGGLLSSNSEALGLEGAIRWHGATVEFDGVCASDGCVPGLRSLVLDQPQTLRRWRFGDLPSASAGGLALPGLRGVAVGTAFELAPTQSYTPDLDAPVELNSAATVEVLVNNRTVQRFELPAGRYSVRDFPLAFGANTA